jgi:hypothetical protein
VRLFFLAIILIPAVLFVYGCSDEEGEDSTVDVTLTDFEVAADPDSVPEGDVTFDVENDGKETHELIVVKTDFDASDLPTEDDGSMDDGADGIDKIGETNDIESGDSDSRSFSLDPGSYVLLCNRVEDGESHFAQGMHTPFTVTEEE